jgi:class 3 adenylate cyclase
MPTCHVCRQDNPTGARFCNACGSPLDGEARPLREERKVVTVLFADLVGFTARSERMDPEDVQRLLQPYHAQLRSVLERHGGTVAKFVGDAVMAIFGAPVAHEDDPERAVRAALAIREELAAGGDLEVHIGITTGEALITLDARIEQGEHTASGDSVNTAARLESAAPAGSIFVDEATRRATGRSIEFDDAPPVVAKGKSDPIRVWDAVRPRTPVAGRRASDTPLVGRERELTLLRGTVDRVQREREPQLLTLIGVPGIGKTRLVSELARELSRHGDWGWLEGRSLPYGEGATFWPFCEIVRGFTGVLDSDDDEGRRARSTAPSRRSSRSRRRSRGSNGICGPWSASIPTISAPATDAARPSPPGDGSWRRWPRNNRSSSCSTTCTGRTTHYLTSWITSSTGPAAFRSSCSRRPDPTSSTVGPIGEGGARTSPRSGSRRCPWRRRPGSSVRCSLNRPHRNERTPTSSSARAATRSTRRSSLAWCWTGTATEDSPGPCRD